MKELLNSIHPLDLALKHGLLGEFDQAEKILNSLSLDDPRVRFNLGWYKMKDGDLLGGLDYLNAGRFINCFGLPPIHGKLWKNEDLNGKTLLFRCEGGFGDQIMNIRFVNDFKKLGATVIVSCDPLLFKLFSDNGMICIDNDIAERCYYDYWVPGMSAAFMLGYSYDNLRGESYLTANKRTLYSKNKNLKVGIRWSGNPQFEHEQHRRFDPALMIDLHSVGDITMYSLQRDENLIYGLPFADLKDEMKSWTDTAEIIKGLDLVITSCTSVAHLAGSLGVETWVIVPVLPYYSWVLPGDTSPWYNTVRLFRQQTYGKWESVFENVKKELINKIGETRCDIA